MKTRSEAIEEAEVTKRSSREATGIHELDNVLGGGLRVGKVTVLTGPRGVGKSTLFMQVLQVASRCVERALFVSGEIDRRTFVNHARRIRGEPPRELKS